MLLSPQGVKADRSGLFQSHRGNQLRLLMILLGLVGVVLWVLTGLLGPSSEEREAAAAREAAATAALEEGDAQADNSEPSWVAAQHDPFAVNGVAALPDGFNGSDAHTELLRTATTTAVQVSTYSSRETPQDYVDGIEVLSDSARATALAAAEASWGDIEESGVVVTAVASGTEPVVRAYDEETLTASVEAVADITITNAEGVQQNSARAYLVHLTGTEAEDGTVTWQVTGYESR